MTPQQKAVQIILEIYLQEPGKFMFWGGCVHQRRGWMTVYDEDDYRLIHIKPKKGGNFEIEVGQISDDNALAIISRAEGHIDQESGSWSYDKGAYESAKKQAREFCLLAFESARGHLTN